MDGWLSCLDITKLAFWQISWWEPKAEYSNGEEHRNSFEDVEWPLVAEWIPVDAHREFDKTVNGTDLATKLARTLAFGNFCSL
jgi:hypothetical protein